MTSVSCSDSEGNIYAATVVASSTLDGKLTECTAKATHALKAGDVVTVRYNGVGVSSLMSVNGVSSLASSGAIDKTSASSGQNTSPNSGNVTTTNATDLLFGAFVYNGMAIFTSGFPNTVGVVSVGNGVGNKRTLVPSYELVNSTGTYSLTGTLSSSEPWRAALIAYK